MKLPICKIKSDGTTEWFVKDQVTKALAGQTLYLDTTLPEKEPSELSQMRELVNYICSSAKRVVKCVDSKSKALIGYMFTDYSSDICYVDVSKEGIIKSGTDAVIHETAFRAISWQMEKDLTPKLDRPWNTT